MLRLRYLGGEEAEVVEGLEEAQRLLGRALLDKRISVIEALYLLYAGNAKAVGPSGEEMGFRELIVRLGKENPYIWVEFEVYYDLRRRGKLPVPGPRPHSLLLRRSKRDPRYTHYILVLEESRRIPVEQLYSFIEEAAGNNWEPVLAIVDRYGDITYYTAKRLRPAPRR